MNDVYQKVGATLELIQLMEYELGTLFIRIGDISPNMMEIAPELSWGVINEEYHPKLKFLIGQLEGQHDAEQIIQVLNDAFTVQLCLKQTFFRTYHDQSTEVILEELEKMSSTLLNGYQTVVQLSGMNID